MVAGWVGAGVLVGGRVEVVVGTAVGLASPVGVGVVVTGVAATVGVGVLVAGGVPVTVGVAVAVGTAVPVGMVPVAVGEAVPSVVADGVGDGKPVAVAVSDGFGVRVGNTIVGGAGIVAGMGGRYKYRPANIRVSVRQLARMIAYTVVP